ncbi:hypothetical protein J4E93_008072 [Alternaria ventricosa]|uniref:uncharacterized protein n=1 Tax=Alternaria ventricosa TaxID=1187951 RepID=UPI0020C4F64C|nr:uncharacterized protein J4E93_008072 [Alternaria ventricosa]KAI4641193.1 hypothetical protein J4E93_008072 [Alternaria ventricosa]
MDMNKPIFTAPPGYIVDVDNPQRTGEAANFWIGTLGMIVAAIFMAIRVYTKTRLAKNFTPDDIALLIAWCFSIAIQVPILFQYGRGTLGVHIWELTGHRVNSTMNDAALYGDGGVEYGYGYLVASSAGADGG